MTYYHLAFFIGLFGSIHCVAMCGPLILAIDRQLGFSWRVLQQRLLYQLGRIMMYGFLGLLLGVVGNLAFMRGWQQGFSIVMGVILVALAIVFMFGKRHSGLAAWQVRALKPLTKMMGSWLNMRGAAFFVGILNGILPCGMVYMALASAMSADSVSGSFFFMLCFGLGTLPLLFVFSIIGGVSRSAFKSGFNRLIPFLYLLMGVWFILRGANLDIPYLSPLLHVEGAIHCM
ncbi:sulfite exporter TauE/SafE family protein [Sphingobacterium deserti]|uniref:Integral membrane protein n=1 Tax=Sphingobacterium deserti TaxID=1229276 RepID=A0A0B8TC01_9SPHI|nr:sulfite exporter TauE/SafE family protein [Sphingobacterium deserti]KGE15805.1 integral membrane protein [Sphingobacterium deserti]